ncbi:MAG: phosphodiesterase [Christensenellaceae bacterium]|jgi:putative phosphoesterase|nr:phosphodiesterase [Christensenellaceae bacterium]
MKILFASDLHGSATATEALLDRLEIEGARRLVLLGDLLYHGPRNPLPKGYDPQIAAKLLSAQKEKILCVRGNCDADVDQLLLPFPIGAENLLLYLGEIAVFATHGHHASFENPPFLRQGDAFLQGHTHVKRLEKQNGLLLLNPGSVSLPKDGDEGSYLLWEDGVFALKTLDGREISALEAERPPC